MKKYGFIKWTESKETFTKIKGLTSRESEIKAHFFVIDFKKVKNFSIPSRLKLSISKS